MATRHILKVPIESPGSSSRKNSSPIDLLLSVSSPIQSTLSGTLTDLFLEATDGQTAFSSHLYSSRLGKLLKKDSGLTIPQFEAVLSRILLQRPLPTDIENDELSLHGIHLIAILSRSGKEESVILRFHNVMSDVKQYVAEIVLPETLDVELNIVEWALNAVEHGRKAESESDSLRVRLEEAEKGAETVKKQLNELRAVKENDEKTLLGKFVEVLDRKKARIRELERDAGGGRRPWREIEEDAIKEEDEENSRHVRGGGRVRARGKSQAKAGPSRTNKRKQAQTQAEPEAAPKDDQNDGSDPQQQEEEDAETDRESLQEIPANEDVDMTWGSDDPEATSRTDHGSSTNPKGSTSTQAGKGKQHALRTRAAPELEDESTDDEL